MGLRDWWGGVTAALRGDPRAPIPQNQPPEQYQTTSGVTVSEDTALTLPALLGGVRALSEDVASTPLHMYKRTKRGRDTAFWHAAYALLHDKPNTAMTPVDMWGCVMYGAIMWGAGYVFIERASSAGTRWDGAAVKPGDALSLWPIQQPQRMITWLNGSEIHYCYITDTGEAVYFDSSELIPVRGFSKDGIYGIGVLKAGAETIGVGLATQVYAAAFFGNGTRVGGTVTVPAGLNLSETAKKNLERSLVDRRGPSQSWKARVLYDGVTYEPDGSPPKDSQMLEQRVFTVGEVCRLLRITPDQLGELTNATYSNISQQAINYVTKCLRPWYVRIAQAVNCFLLSNDERGLYYAEHQTEALLVGDIDSTYKAFGTALDKGFMNRDEVRSKINMNSLPGGQGQAYLVQVAQTTIGHVIEGGNLKSTPTVPPGDQPVA